MESQPELPENNSVEEESPVQIQPSIEQVENVAVNANVVEEGSEGEIDPRLFLELGDKVWIDSEKYGGPVIGRIYFREPDLIRVMPNGISNRLYDFPRIFTEDSDTFDEDLGVRVAYVIEKHPFDRFVELEDLQVGQTFDGLSSNGELVGKYRIRAIDIDRDAILIEDSAGQTSEIEFGFAGIPRDVAFSIISVTGFDRATREGQPAATETQTTEEILTSKIVPEAVEGNFVEDEVAVPLSSAGMATEAAKIVKADEATVATKPRFKIEIVAYVDVPIFEATEELKLSERVYPDSIQKIDALNDLLNLLDSQEQKSLILQRSIRILMETLFHLKQETISRTADGRIRGPKKLSSEYLIDLFTMHHFPMGRPVLDIALKLLTIPSDNILDDDSVQERTEDYYIQNILTDFIESANEYQTQSIPPIAAEKGSPQFYKNLASFILKKLDSVQANNATYPTYEAKIDSEYFRRAIPDREAPPIEGVNKSSFTEVEQKKGEKVKYGRDKPFNLIGTSSLSYSNRRLLTKTPRKDVDELGKSAPSVVFLPAEKATVDTYLIMPINETKAFGSTRSGSLAVDIATSKERLTLISDILRKYGDPTNIPTANGFVLLDAKGSSLSNIPLVDYIRPQKIRGYGLGDFSPFLANLGLDTQEYSHDLAYVLGDKITKTQNMLKAILNSMRESIAQESGRAAVEGAPQVPVSVYNPHKNLQVLNESAKERLEQSIRKEPLLVDALEQFQKINPTLSQSDIAQFSYLVSNMAEYLYAALGEQATQVAKERLRATKNLFLKVIDESRRIKQKNEQSGKIPQPNGCEHISKLNTVRKIRDDQERYILLAKLLTKYQGSRSGNYIECSLCEGHLMCVHERLSIQAFLNPRERDQIQKDIYLNFSGGQFHGKFICRNCGQVLTDIPYDTNIEFDDQGRPMMGRAVLDTTGTGVGEDSEKLLEVALGAQIGSVTEISFADELDNSIYVTIKELADRLGVSMNNEGFRRVMENVKSIISKLKSAIKYKEFRDALDPTKRARVPDYPIYRAQNIVISSAAMLLIEIQTQIPDYIVRHSIVGCQAGFTGYPLGSSDDKTGINYLACAVASVRKNQSPWSETTFMREKNMTALQTRISANIYNLITNVLPQMPGVSLGLAEKRKYIEIITGQDPSKRIHDEVHNNFLPLLENVTPEQAAATAIVPEAASEVQKVRAWIRSGHALARATAVLLLGSPYLETTCCLSNISSPLLVFSQSIEKFPVLLPRTIIPASRNKFLQVHFLPRQYQDIAVAPQSELNYRLFLSVCFRGQRVGLPHELGLTNKCRWCGFQFPGFPKDIKVDVEGRDALESQSVETTQPEFQKLLDSIHLAYQVEETKQPEVSSQEQMLNKIGIIEPAPVDNWRYLVTSTFTAIKSLGANIPVEDLVVALGELSETAATLKQQVFARLSSPVVQGFLERIAHTHIWSNFKSILESYFIINSNKIVGNNNLGIQPFLSVPTNFEISQDHKDTIVKNIFTPEIKLVTSLLAALKPKDTKKKDNLGIFVRGKLNLFVKQLDAIINLDIRSGLIPGGSKTLEYIQEILFYGPLSNLLNPNVFPLDDSVEAIAPDESVYGNGSKLIMTFIQQLLIKFNQEQITFSDEQVRNLIEIRNEKERQNIIKDFDELDEEMRGIELMKKFLGMGRWAFGASKAVYAYDPEQWDKERKERESAGISDFPGVGPDGEGAALINSAAAQEGAIFSPEGIFGNGEFYDNINDGYDIDQMMADEY